MMASLFHYCRGNDACDAAEYKKSQTNFLGHRCVAWFGVGERQLLFCFVFHRKRIIA